MNKCLFLAVFAVLWSGCSRSEQAGVPTSIYEAFAIHPDSARFESLMLDLVESGDQTEEAWGAYFVARDIVRNGVSFDAITYLERAELLFRATKNSEGIKRVLLLKAHAYWALGGGEEILSIAEETMRMRESNSKSWATAAGNYTTYLLDYGR